MEGKIKFYISKLLLISLLIVMNMRCTTSYSLTDEAQEITNSFKRITNAEKTDLMSGSEYSTPVFVFDSGKRGKNILILGGTHGNEPAGYEAALRLLKHLENKPPELGKVIIIPLANRQSVVNYSRHIPVPDGIDEEKGNLNRCYPGKENGLPMEKMAFAIEQISRKHKVDVFIDLHEARYFHLNTPKGSYREKGLGQTIIYYPNEKSSWLLMNLLDDINGTIKNEEERFSAVEKPIMNSAAWWAGEKLSIAAYTFETMRKMKLEKRIVFHTNMVMFVLEFSEIW